MSTSFTSISAVDFGRLRDPSTKKAELEVLRAAVFDVGFLYIINTGLEVPNIVFRIRRVADKRFRAGLDRGDASRIA